MPCYLPTCCNTKHFEAQLFFFYWFPFGFHLFLDVFTLVGQRSPTSHWCSFFTCISATGTCGTLHSPLDKSKSEALLEIEQTTAILYFIIVACFMMTRAHYFLISLKIHKSWNLFLFALGKMDSEMPSWLIVSVCVTTAQYAVQSLRLIEMIDNAIINASRWFFHRNINKYVHRKFSQRWEVMHFHSITGIRCRAAVARCYAFYLVSMQF